MKSTAVKRKATDENNPIEDLGGENCTVLPKPDNGERKDGHEGHRSRVNERHQSRQTKLHFRIPLKKRSDANKTATGIKEIL